MPDSRLRCRWPRDRDARAQGRLQRGIVARESPYLISFHARSLHVVYETAPAALISPPVVLAVFWTHASRATLVLPTLRFPAVHVAAVLSYFCHIVRDASAPWMHVQSLADSILR